MIEVVTSCSRLVRCMLVCFLYYSAENVFAMKSWCKTKFSIEESEIDKQFGIPDDFDYV